MRRWRRAKWLREDRDGVVDWRRMHGRMRGLRLALPEGELTLVEDNVP